ncbi:MAG: hypothetical protein WC846_00660 [Candidatus Gracilibacteria bacterium]|jgi:hypothetical protein
MVKRFLLSFLAVVVYMGIFALILLPLTLAYKSDDRMMVTIVLSATALFLLGFIPGLDFVAKKIWVFKTEEKSTIGEEELRKRILEINEFDVPVVVEEKGSRLVVTWKYLDAKWWEIISKNRMKKVYQLIVKLDGEKKLATLIDVNKFVMWGVGPTSVKVFGGYFRGIMVAFEIGKRWGIKENFSVGKIYDYKFNPSEIKNPVMNTILKSGWDVRFGIW